jgi:membrane protein implicated in regulation of membrane protease activity
MLAPRLRKMSVGERIKWLATAISVTVLDAAAVTCYGGAVWKAFAAVIWSKVLLFLLAAVWATMLLHIWVHACSRRRQKNQECRVEVSTPVKGLSAELTEEIDV